MKKLSILSGLTLLAAFCLTTLFSCADPFTQTLAKEVQEDILRVFDGNLNVSVEKPLSLKKEGQNRYSGTMELSRKGLVLGGSKKIRASVTVNTNNGTYSYDVNFDDRVTQTTFQGARLVRQGLEKGLEMIESAVN